MILMVSGATCWTIKGFAGATTSSISSTDSEIETFRGGETSFCKNNFIKYKFQFKFGCNSPWALACVCLQPLVELLSKSLAPRPLHLRHPLIANLIEIELPSWEENPSVNLNLILNSHFSIKITQTHLLYLLFVLLLATT